MLLAWGLCLVPYEEIEEAMGSCVCMRWGKGSPAQAPMMDYIEAAQVTDLDK